MSDSAYSFNTICLTLFFVYYLFFTSMQLSHIPDPFNRGRRSVNLASAPLLFGFFLTANTFALVLFFIFWILAYTLFVHSAIRTILFQLILPSPEDDLQRFVFVIFEVPCLFDLFECIFSLSVLKNRFPQLSCR